MEFGEETTSFDFFTRGADEFRFDDEGLPTATTDDQEYVERKIRKILLSYRSQDPQSIELLREKHEAYLLRGLERMGSGYQSLDASRPWLCYWILHGLDLLDAFPSKKVDNIVDFLSRCQNPDGGFGGGPGQLSHLAPTYAAVNALMICESERGYKMINREKMYKFLLSVKEPSGGFVMHKNGESDVRGSYCALSVASLLNIITPELVSGVAEYIASCQSYEGGIGGEPGNEAHGGYAFCGFAALMIIQRPDAVDLDRLLSWAIWRQMPFEGGFQGRTNKLVDACYSWWQGGLFPLLDLALNRSKSSKEEQEDDDGDYLYIQRDLQHYLLACCQDKGGGLKDKPEKSKDFYHTCYALSGLSSSQHNRPSHSPTLVGNPKNLLMPTHPIHNIRPERVANAFRFFSGLSLPVHPK